MFERLHRLYSQGKLSDRGLDRAVFKGLISQVQAMKIRNTPYEEDPILPDTNQTDDTT